jgi:hypothetical protein
MRRMLAFPPDTFRVQCGGDVRTERPVPDDIDIRQARLASGRPLLARASSPR